MWISLEDYFKEIPPLRQTFAVFEVNTIIQLVNSIIKLSNSMQPKWRTLIRGLLHHCTNIICSIYVCKPQDIINIKSLKKNNHLLNDTVT